MVTLARRCCYWSRAEATSVFHTIGVRRHRHGGDCNRPRHAEGRMEQVCLLAPSSWCLTLRNQQPWVPQPRTRHDAYSGRADTFSCRVLLSSGGRCSFRGWRIRRCKCFQALLEGKQRFDSTARRLYKDEEGDSIPLEQHPVEELRMRKLQNTTACTCTAPSSPPLPPPVEANLRLAFAVQKQLFGELRFQVEEMRKRRRRKFEQLSAPVRNDCRTNTSLSSSRAIP